MILMNDFRSEPSSLREAMYGAVRRVIDSGQFVLGDEVASFESEWSARCKTSHAIGVGNGMDALEIIFRALGVGPGDEVITTPMTAFATVLAILRAGAEPVLADIEPSSALLDRDSVLRCLSSRTRALVLVHLYGQLGDMASWKELCADHGIYLVEDCAQSHLASRDGKVAGSFGAAGAYSFYPTKNLGGAGDGGMIVTNDGVIAEMALKMRNYGQSRRYSHPVVGLNSRLDELQAAILRVRADFLDEFTSRRRAIATRYHKEIENVHVDKLAPANELAAHVHHLYVVTTPYRDRLIDYLRFNGIQALIHFPIPIHLQPPCLHLRRDAHGLSAAEHHADTCLSIPCHPQLSDDDVSKVISTINRFEV
ncbi:DegT/DnrJ/EryC1/StrS family aminotransferase [Haliea sp.]|uniref:DegT/DnrJ/EryC1/StrS family aminotransferase n=1 Tax=Haliea sp. TaxID=1932666 RepID=UPI003527B94E